MISRRGLLGMCLNEDKKRLENYEMSYNKIVGKITRIHNNIVTEKKQIKGLEKKKREIYYMVDVMRTRIENEEKKRLG